VVAVEVGDENLLDLHRAELRGVHLPYRALTDVKEYDLTPVSERYGWNVPLARRHYASGAEENHLEHVIPSGEGFKKLPQTGSVGNR